MCIIQLLNVSNVEWMKAVSSACSASKTEIIRVIVLFLRKQEVVAVTAETPKLGKRRVFVLNIVAKKRRL